LPERVEADRPPVGDARLHERARVGGHGRGVGLPVAVVPLRRTAVAALQKVGRGGCSARDTEREHHGDENPESSIHHGVASLWLGIVAMRFGVTQAFFHYSTYSGVGRSEWRAAQQRAGSRRSGSPTPPRTAHANGSW